LATITLLLSLLRLVPLLSLSRLAPLLSLLRLAPLLSLLRLAPLLSLRRLARRQIGLRRLTALLKLLRLALREPFRLRHNGGTRSGKRGFAGCPRWAEATQRRCLAAGRLVQ
jgi:hypothetical protein